MATFFKSTKMSRVVQRANAVAEIVASATKATTLAASLPSKVSQTIASFYAAHHADTNKLEKYNHIVQGVLSLAQMSMMISLLFLDEDCKDYDTDLCKSFLILDWVYQGILLAGWSGSEIVKEEAASDPSSSYYSGSESSRDASTPLSA